MNIKVIRRTAIFAALLLINIFLLEGCAGIGGAGHARPSTSTNIQKITLMLPLNGVYAAQSNAVKNGFFAAYYEAKQSGRSLDINVVDTTGRNITALYNTAVTNGADMVVGPLTKGEVARLASLAKLPVPVLALNTLQNYQSKAKTNLYQFGLSPQDDVVAVADKIASNGHTNIAVIYPANTWGQNLIGKFKGNFQAKGGKIVAEMSYAGSANFDSQVRNLMQIDSEAFDKARDIRADQKDQVQVAHRTDIDAIFLISYPREARQIVPLLRFYYADNIPIYATSTIYSGVPNPSLDQDLNGVKFCDIPWVVSPTGALPHYLQEVREAINSTWPQSAVKYGKLYALGVDAYTLATAFNAFVAAPNRGIAGATGVLYLDSYNHVYRKLMWATMRRGQPGL